MVEKVKPSKAANPEEEMDHEEIAQNKQSEASRMLTALTWVPKGAARAILQQADPEADEMNIARHAKLQQKLAQGVNLTGKDIGETAQLLESKLKDDVKIDSDDEEDNVPIFTPELAAMKARDQGKQAPIDDEAMQDDDLMGGRDQYPDEFSDSEEEKEDYAIRKTDSLIVAATTEADHSNLEVYIYEHEKGNLYVHHELILGAYPLCLEWIPTWQGSKANVCAVGTFLPEIEIWNLDSEGCDPIALLGSVDLSEQAKSQTDQASVAKKYKKKGQKASAVLSDLTHTDAVMCLSLNPFQSEYLASGSADKTVRVWDLDELTCKMVYSDLHTDKVQAVRWNLKNEQVMLTGGYDGRVNVIDVRGGANRLTSTLSKSTYQDIESAHWHPQSEHNFVVTTESGHFVGFDTRRMDSHVFSVKGHKKACSSAAFSPHLSNMLATVGTDKICKIWDITAGASSDGSSFTPLCIQQKDMKQGDLFSVQMYADIPWVLACGGQKGELAIWDTEEDKKIKAHFAEHMPVNAKKLKKVADRGQEVADADMMADVGDSSDFEDVDSDEEELDGEDDTREEVPKSKKSKK